MKATKGRRGQWLIAICGMAFLFTGTGCSVFLASVDPSSLPDFAPGSSRQEVRKDLGGPNSSETRDDGTRVETYHFLRKVQTEVTSGGGTGVSHTLSREVISEFFRLNPLAPPVLMGVGILGGLKALDEAIGHRAFVYGPDDRLLFSYDPNALPGVRFQAAHRGLDELQRKQLENDKCLTWSACFTPYLDELRKRAAFVGYTLRPEEEENFQRLLQIAKDVDGGRITRGEGLIGVAGRIDQRGSELLSEVFWGQLENDRCPRWIGCVTFYVEGLRRRGAVTGYALSSEEEENFQRLLELAKDVDGGKITQEEALKRLRSCVNVIPYYSRGSC